MKKIISIITIFVFSLGIFPTNLFFVESTYAYTSTLNPHDPVTADPNYEIKIPDLKLKEIMNKVISETVPVSVRQATDPIFVKDARRVNAGFYNGNTLINKGIENLEGLQYFINVGTIHLSKNTPKSSNKTPLDITPLKTLKKLVNLRIGENHIPQAKLAEVIPNLTNLQELHIDQNQTSNLDFITGLTKLKDLRISGAHNYQVPLTDISPVSGLTNLESLHFNYVNVGANALIHITPLTKLYTLQATKSGITTIDPIKNITTLKYLFLNQNDLTDHNLISNFVNLEHLELNKTNLTELSFLTSLSKLNTLGIMDNAIENFEPLIQLAPTLKALYARSTTMDDEDLTHIGQLVNLKTLFIRNNNISNLSPLKDLSLTAAEFQSQKKTIEEINPQVIPNPLKDKNGNIVPVINNSNVENVDSDGNPDQNGGFLKIKKEGQGTVTVNWNENNGANGFSGILTIPYNINLTAPIVDITNFTNINSSNATNYELSGTCSEIGKQVTIKIGNLAPIIVDCEAPGVFSKTGIDVSSLSEGDLEISASQINNSNIEGKSTKSIKKDTVVPTATITPSTTAPTQGPVTLTLEANEAIQTPAGWTEVPGSNGKKFTKQVEDNGEVSVNITDIAGNPNPTPISYNVTNIDKTGPEITITNANNTPAISKEVSASVTEGRIEGYAVVPAGTVCDSNLTYISGTSVTLNSEDNNGQIVCFKAVDDLGNESFKASNPISGIDTTKPKITSANADISGGVNNPVINFSGEDNGSGIKEWRIKIDNNATVTLPASDTSYIPVGLSGNNHIVEIELVDKAGNISEKRTLRFPPSVKIISPTTESKDDINDTSIEITGPAGMKIKNISLSGVGNPTLTCTNLPSDTNLVEVPFTCQIKNITESGKLEVMVTSKDNFEGSSEQNYIIDKQKPTLTLNSVSATETGTLNYITKEDTSTVVFTAKDTGGSTGNLITECSVNGGAWEVCNSPYNFNLDREENRLKIRAKDSTGNLSEEKEITIIKDKTPPSLEDIQDKEFIKDKEINPIKIKSEDNSKIEVTGLADGLIFDETTKEIKGTPTKEGDYKVTVKVTDNAGNETVKTFNIKVKKETVNPSSGGSSPSSGSFTVPNDNRVNGGNETNNQNNNQNNNTNQNDNTNQNNNNQNNNSNTTDTNNLTKEQIKKLEENLKKVNKELKIKNINGETKLYTLSNKYKGCPMIPNIVGDYNKDFQLKFKDINTIKNLDEVQRLAKVDVVNERGVNNTDLFEANRGITRAEFLAIVLKVHCYDVSEKPESLPFYDVDLDTWQAKVVKVGSEIGIIKGYEKDKKGVSFRPNAKISKIEAFGIMMKMREIQILNNYQDRYVDKKAEWQAKPLSAGEYLGIINPENTDFRFNPDSHLTRDDMVKLIVDIVRLY